MEFVTYGCSLEKRKSFSLQNVYRNWSKWSVFIDEGCLDFKEMIESCFNLHNFCNKIKIPDIGFICLLTICCIIRKIKLFIKYLFVEISDII